MRIGSCGSKLGTPNPREASTPTVKATKKGIPPSRRARGVRRNERAKAIRKVRRKGVIEWATNQRMGRVRLSLSSVTMGAFGLALAAERDVLWLNLATSAL